MAITSAICNSFKQEILESKHDFTASTGNTFKIALIKAQSAQAGTYGRLDHKLHRRNWK